MNCRLALRRWLRGVGCLLCHFGAAQVKFQGLYVRKEILDVFNQATQVLESLGCFAVAGGGYEDFVGSPVQVEVNGEDLPELDYSHGGDGVVLSSDFNLSGCD